MYFLFTLPRELLISLFFRIIVILIFFREIHIILNVSRHEHQHFQKLISLVLYFLLRDDDGIYFFSLFKIFPFLLSIFLHCVHFKPFLFRKMCSSCNWVQENVLCACAHHIFCYLKLIGLYNVHYVFGCVLPWDYYAFCVMMPKWQFNFVLQQYARNESRLLATIFRDAIFAHNTHYTRTENAMTLRLIQCLCCFEYFSMNRNWLLHL